MKAFDVVLYGLLAALSLGCTEVIEFDTARVGGQLVVDGRIAVGNGPFRLNLRETATENRKTFPVTGAEITIFDDAGQSESYQEMGDGAYLLHANAVQGRIGGNYYLEIRLPNGEIYQSKPETIPQPAGKQDSITYDLGKQDFLNRFGNPIPRKIINIYVDVTLNEETREDFFLRWDVEEVYRITPTFFPCGLCTPPPSCYVYVYTSAQDFTLF